MPDSLFVLWLAAIPLMGSPGPATMSLAGLGASFGFRPALPYLLGIILGTTGVLMLIATGVTALVLAEPVLVTVLTGVAAAYILYLAWKIATAPVGRSAQKSAAAPGFIPGLGLALANPKAFAAIGAVYAGHTLVPGSLAADTAAKLAALFLVITVVNPLWLAFGASFATYLARPITGRAARIVFALLLIASVALALLTA